jgi:hypothetical protein
MEVDMKKSYSILAGFVLLALLFAAPLATSVNAKGDSKLLEWESMVGVPRPYTGAVNAIRGISGGGLPWVIASGKGELTTNGKLEVKVTGLVIDPNDPAAIANGNAGRNPAAQFKAIVSCQTLDASGAAVVVNVSSPLVNATVGLASAGGGNAKIETTLSLPRPCIAPLVFVTSANGSWFATIGN